MKGMKKIVVTIVSLMLILGFSTVMAVAAESQENEPVTLSATVNDNFQIVASDGTVYEVDTNDEGNKLVEEVGKKVEVTGVIEIVDDIKSITVLSYKLLE